VAPLVDVPRVEPYYISDAAFSADEAAIVTNGRRTYRLSEPAAEPATATRLDESKCGGVVGQSNIGKVRSRDNRIVVLLLNNKEAPIRLGGNSGGRRPKSAKARSGGKYRMLIVGYCYATQELYGSVVVGN
jgi:hypothetical protein